VSRHRALALAAQIGHARIVRLLLDSDEDLNRYNPDGNHCIRRRCIRLRSRGTTKSCGCSSNAARGSTSRTRSGGAPPEGWAEHARKAATAAYLRAAMRGEA
jgi:hypothetical protein